MRLGSDMLAIEREVWFRRLNEALRTFALPTASGYRDDAKAEEFMLMSVDEQAHGWREAHFKHTASRNYLILSWNIYGETGYPRVPVGGPFNGGVFPAPESSCV